jgi:class 3 adenylate cyclase
MATGRQLQLEQTFRHALKELGSGVSTEFLIAATSERTQADPGEIIEAVEVVNRRAERQGSDEGANGQDDDSTAHLLALGKAVTAIWSNLPKDLNTKYSNTQSPLKMT